MPDIVSLTVRSGFRRWPWPSPLSFRDDEPDIVGLITGTAASQSNELLNTLQEGGISVSAVIGRGDFRAADPDVSRGEPLVSALWIAAKELGKNSSTVHFPRIRLVARLAELDLNSPDAEPVDVLRSKLREICSTRDGTAVPRQNILVTTLQRWPYPFALLGDLAALLVWSQFRLWFSGIPVLGPECRWLRRQRKYLLPEETFVTFLLRLTAGLSAVRPDKRGQYDPLTWKRLAAHALLEDLRLTCQVRLWNRRTWSRNRRPVLILDNLGNELPDLFDKARAYAQHHGAKPDPLLIILTPWSDGRQHDFRLRVVRQVGEPQQVLYPRPNHPLRALMVWGATPLCIVVVAAVVTLRVISVPGAPPGPPAHPPGTHVTASRCAVPAGDGADTDLVAWKDDAGVNECVGFSGSSYVFTNPDFGTNAQQLLQAARMTSDQEQIFRLNQRVDAAAEHPVPGSPGVDVIVYFAGLTESPLDEYDSAEAEEMEGLLAAQRSVFRDDEKPQLKVIIANGGAKMQDARQVAGMIIRRFRGYKHFLGVVGLDRSTGDVKEAIEDFSAARIPILATTLSADGIGGGSPYFFALSPSNTAEARLMLLYIQRAVPRYFEQPASIYPSGGFITAQHIVVYRPEVTDQPNNADDDLYISTLVSDLEHQARNYRGLPRLAITASLNSSRLCGAATVDLYAGRHDRPLDSARASKNDDFSQFLTRVAQCQEKAKPFVIADDGVTRFIADPADRRNLDVGRLPISYVTKGINILSTGKECLSRATASAVTAQPLAGFCAQYASIAAVLRGKGVRLLWTGERVGLGYDAAQMFLQAAETSWRAGTAITRAEIIDEFENPDVGYSLVTGSVSFTKKLHTGADTVRGMPLAIVRIVISNPRALPTCAFTGFNGDRLSPIPNMGNQQGACVDDSP